jgi:hypothetical protein
MSARPSVNLKNRAKGYQKTQDFIYETPLATAPKVNIRCYVEVWEHPYSPPVLLVTQMPDTPISVTNVVEEIATGLCRTLWKDIPSEIAYFEYHPKPHLLQRVQFTKGRNALINPRWNRTDPRLFYLLTGHTIA